MGVFELCMMMIQTNKSRKRVLFVGAVLTIIVFSINHTLIEQRKQQARFLKDCFHNNLTSGITSLPDVTQSLDHPTGKHNIFFHETSCSNDGIIKLNARQLCAIESAAKNNPNWNIYVLFASNTGISNETVSTMLKAVMDTYTNIRFMRVNIMNYAENTPLYEWIKEGNMFDSNYINSHLSDVLRYLTLYKYGGTYLDLDVVVLKKLDEAGVNYSAAESNEDVAAGFINFEPDAFGHQVATMCIRDLLKNFDGYDWGNNGPGTITRVLQVLCGTKDPRKMTTDRCYGFTVYPPSVVYAIPWRKYEMFFSDNKTEEVLSLLQSSFIAHLWNKHSHKIKLKVGSKSAYGKLAETHCPNVYFNCGTHF